MRLNGDKVECLRDEGKRDARLSRQVRDSSLLASFELPLTNAALENILAAIIARDDESQPRTTMTTTIVSHVSVETRQKARTIEGGRRQAVFPARWRTDDGAASGA